MTEQDSSTSGTNNDDNIVSPEKADQVSPEEKADTHEGEGSEKKDNPKSSEENEDKNKENPDAPDTDPIDDLFSEGSEPENSANLSGDKHLEMAVGKKFDELRDGLEEGNSEAIQKFRSLKPKMQEGVAKRFKIDGELVKDTKELLDFLEVEYPENAKKESSSDSGKDEKLIKAHLVDQFRNQAEASGLKFEELKKCGEYGAVVASAKGTIALLKQKGLPLSDFDQFFDFKKEFQNATLDLQKKGSYKDGMDAQRKIGVAQNASSDNPSDKHVGGKDVSGLVNSSDYYNHSDDAWKDAYRAKHEENGIIKFADA